MKIYLSQELEKGFEHWKKIFDSLENRRQKAVIKTILAACEANNQNKMHCVMEIPSMDVIKEYMMNPENPTEKVLIILFFSFVPYSFHERATHHIMRL